MPKEMYTSDYHRASVVKGINGFFQVKAAITVTSGAGTLTLYGVPHPGNVTAPVVDPTLVAAKRPGYRLAIYKITGSDNDSGAGTRNAAIITFKTTGTGTGIIARHGATVDVSATAGWVAQDAMEVTPLVVSDDREGIEIVTSASGDTGSIPVEVLCKMLPVLTPTPNAIPAA